PHFKRETRRIGSDGDEMIVLANHSLAGVALLANDVAEDATFFFIVVVPAIVDFLADAARHDGQGNKLGMGMFDGSASGLAMILENKNVAEALVILKVEHAVAIGPEDVFNGLLRKLRKGGLMLRRLDNDFVRADAVHLVEQALALAVEFAFDAQCRKPIGDHANVPARSVRASAVAAIGQDFGRGLQFISRTKGTILRRPGKHAFPEKIHGPLSAVRRNDYPTPSNRVFT